LVAGLLESVVGRSLSPMKFRRQAEPPQAFGFMIAPMVDILLVVLVFFIVTWNFALAENELDVRVPSSFGRKRDPRT
jgi:biopolymer transport protein ExbD